VLIITLYQYKILTQAQYRKEIAFTTTSVDHNLSTILTHCVYEEILILKSPSPVNPSKTGNQEVVNHQFDWKHPVLKDGFNVIFPSDSEKMERNSRKSITAHCTIQIQMLCIEVDIGAGKQLSGLKTCLRF
jgi:hypothetical protein